MLLVMALMAHIFKVIVIQRNVGVVYVLRCDMHFMMYYVTGCNVAMLAQPTVHHYTLAYKRLSALVPFLRLVKLFCVILHY